MTKELKDQLKEIFKTYDDKGEGSLDLATAVKAIRSVGESLNSEELGEYLKDKGASTDKQGNPTLSLEHFNDLVCGSIYGDNSQKQQELQNAFQVFDMEKKGVIKASEMRYVMTNLGERFSIEEVEELINEAHVDSGGNINYNNFISMMTRK
eukprot:m.339674 g.339674  ORF g.339674 m.339674 type:complete len:152 (-) comp18908_c0_seq1:974-1429(-)